MTEPAQPFPIHTEKFYRVILEAIDAEAETPETFAVKLSSRVRVPLARARLVARCLPYTAKSGLRVEQANRLKTILEEIGGKARVEPHFVTPEAPAGAEASSANAVGRADAAAFACPSCGAEQPPGATFCSFCLRKFRDASSRAASLEERLPGENPLETGTKEKGIGWLSLVRFVRRRPVAVLAALILILSLVVLLK